MKPLRLYYRGNFKPAHSTENHVAASLEALGHEVVRAQEWSGQDGIRWADADPRGCDLMLFTTTWHHDLEEGNAFLSQLDIPSVSFHLDLWWGLERATYIDVDPFFRTDFVFTPDGGHEAEWQSKGINHYFLPAGVFHEETYAARARPNLVTDVAFVGSMNHYHQEWPHRRELIEWLKATYRSRFRHYGEVGTNRYRGERLNRLYASVKVAVGDSLMLGPHFWSDRVYETLGRGGFLIHPETPGLSDEFPEGLPTWPRGDWDALKELIDFYLENDAERERVRQIGHARVVNNFTYKHRMEQVLDVVSQQHPSLLGWPGETRPDTSDTLAVYEVWGADVYRLKKMDLRGQTVIDLGANVGAFALRAAEMGAQVIAVESHPDNYAQFVKNLDLAGANGKVRAVNRAAWGSEGKASAHLGPGEATGSAWVEESKNGGVERVTLEKLLRMAPEGDIGLLKVDVEGSEYQILENAPVEVLRRFKRIALEFHDFSWAGRPRPEGALGRILEKLAETHALEVMGRPSAGGYLFATRHA